MSRPFIFLAALLALGCSQVTPTAIASPGAPDLDYQPRIEDMVRNLHLPTIRNARDLGGLHGAHGIIPHGRFFRAATLNQASDEDRRILLLRGVRFDIDLRTIFEAEQRPDRLKHDARFRYERISLLGVGLLEWFHASHLSEIYVSALENHQSAFRRVFRTLAAKQDGGVLFHCTSGKDRTGMVTAMLFDLAGVERQTIVHDYAISSHYLLRAPDTNTRAEGTVSPPAVMRRFLDVLHAHYGGAHAYLLRVGVPEADIQTLLRRLGQ